MNKKIGVVSLGCSKNRVDTETMLGYLQQGSYKITTEPNQADILIVNTCGFIDPAKEESVDTILEMAEYKKTGKCKVLIVTGCLSQRYGSELYEELPEVDVFLGVNDYHEIVNVIENAFPGESSPSPKAILNKNAFDPRVLTTPQHTAYLKIGEGCDNCCTYCIIPQIRGPYRSRPLESLLEEANYLASCGVRELIVIAQDTTRYGEDLYGKSMLPELLKRICKIKELHWIRVLYSYPEKISEELLDVIETEPKLCNYLDIPIQHIDDFILQSMNRLSSSSGIKALMQNIRSRKAEFVLRSSIIVGFPGEDDEAFQELLHFIQAYPFDRMGVFSYSKEEGTAASDYPDQVPENIKQTRYDELMKLQQKISSERNAARVGKTYEVLIEGHHRSNIFYGRSFGEAPEIDGKIYVKSHSQLAVGSFIHVRIIKAYEYDLLGEVFHESGE